jgi:peptidoglycan/xylan/chitin deacetylase (PgdA/CDA1 family)
MSLEETLPVISSGETTRNCPVALTFDDGFRDFYSVAWSILRQHAFSATVYLPTGFVSEEAKLFRGKRCLTWDEVRELRRNGIHFGSHTINHPKLYELSWREIQIESTISKERIQQELQQEITSFAYPYAFPQEDECFTQRLRHVLRKAGYRNCATTMIGRAEAESDSFYLRRLPINSCDDKILFAAKLGGAYDWLGHIQRASRVLKRGASGRRTDKANLT